MKNKFIIKNKTKIENTIKFSVILILPIVQLRLTLKTSVSCYYQLDDWFLRDAQGCQNSMDL